jgi:glycosyltransferase involved in cell wall biosynthesis
LEVEIFKTPVRGAQLRRAISDSAGCICVSHSLQNTLTEMGVDRDKTCVIHNAVNRDVFRPQSKSQIRAKLGLTMQQPIVVSVGNLLAVKRHHVLIEAFAKILGAMPDARLVIIGGAMHEPDYPESLSRLCDALGVSGSVIFSGTLPPSDIVKWLAAADVFALASSREGCCNALLEALACGVPVVVTSVGDNDVFVEQDTNGYLVPVDDSAALSNSLQMALERRDWDRDSISTGLKVGNWDSVASQVFDFMNERMQINNGKVG